MPIALATLCFAALARPVPALGIGSARTRLGLARGRGRNASSGSPFLSPGVASSLAGMEVDNPSEEQLRDMYGILQHLYAGVPVDFRQPQGSAGTSARAANSTVNRTSLLSGRGGTRIADFSGTWRLKQVAGDIEAVLLKMSVTPIVVFTLKHLDWGVGKVYETITQAGDTFTVTTMTGLSHEKKTQTFTVGTDFEMESEDKSDGDNGEAEKIEASSEWNETTGALTNRYQHGLFLAEMARELRDDGPHLLENLTVWGSTMYMYWETYTPPATPPAGPLALH